MNKAVHPKKKKQEREFIKGKRKRYDLVLLQTIVAGNRIPERKIYIFRFLCVPRISAMLIHMKSNISFIQIYMCS